MYIKKQLTFLELVFIYYHWVHHCVHWVPCSYTISFNLLNNPLRCYYHCFKGGWIRSWGRVQFSSVQFSCSVVSNSLWPHESQHARPPCPSPTPGVHSDSRPLSQWCHLILCCPLLLLTPIPPSIRVFSNESTLENVEVAKVLEFQL